MHAREALAQVVPATRADIQPGAILWHVYGFPGSSPEPLQLITGPVSEAVIDAHEGWEYEPRFGPEYFEPNWFIAYYMRGIQTKTHRSLHDCGIDIDYNGNRLFTTKEEAEKYCRLLNS